MIQYFREDLKKLWGAGKVSGLLALTSLLGGKHCEARGEKIGTAEKQGNEQKEDVGVKHFETEAEIAK